MMSGSELRRQRVALNLSQAKFAKIANIPQHYLSAFELGKHSLPESLVEKISILLSNKEALTPVVKKKKRYQAHSYGSVKRDHDRAKRNLRSEGNLEYTDLLTDLVNRTKITDDAPRALSLFSGCGGFSLGFKWAGFRIAGFLEKEADFQRIYQKNFPESQKLGDDITQVSNEILKKLSKGIGRIDVLIGGPPRQGFSLSGKRDVNDSRNTLFKHYLRFVEIFQPKIAIMENVRLLTSMKNTAGGFVRDDILRDFTTRGYKVKSFEINAKNYGVPQHRERVVFVAVRNDLNLEPTIPEPTHGGSSDLFAQIQKYRSFADACSDLPYLESGEASATDSMHEAVKHPDHVINWLWNVKEGCSAHDNEDETLRPPSGYNTTYKRQVWNEPASTVQTTFGMISGCRNVHPIATRSLTIREAMRIQSFPDSFLLEGTLGSIRTSIGNAVPPLLAYCIGEHIKKMLS